MVYFLHATCIVDMILFFILLYHSEEEDGGDGSFCSWRNKRKNPAKGN